MTRHPTTLIAALLLTLVVAGVFGSTRALGEDEGPGGIIVPPPLPCVGFDDSYEQNDTSGTASDVKLPFADDNLLSCDGDDDWFAFSAPQGADINIHADFVDASGDVDIRLFDPSDGLLAFSLSTSDDETISVPANDSGIFKLRVNMFDDPDGFGNQYDLDIDVGCPPADTIGGAFADVLQEPLPIPNSPDPGAINCIDVVAAGVVNNLSVGIEISHTWVGDLIVTLEHVDTGTEVVLIDRPGTVGPGFGCMQNDIDVVLSDGGGSDVEDACDLGSPSISGTLRPNGDLSDFNGEALAGEWRLQVTDAAGGDSGTLNEWYIESTVKADTPTPTASPTATVPAATSTPTPTATPTAVPATNTPTATPTPAKAVGDVNDDGNVNAIDAALVLQFGAGLVLSLPNEPSGDANNDGSLNALDAALILQFDAGLIPMLPP